MSIMLIMSCYTGFFNVRREDVDILIKYTYKSGGGYPPRECAEGRIGTRFLRPRGTSPLQKGVNPAGTPGYRNGTESFFGLKG
jgi:hypothetical protein